MVLFCYFATHTHTHHFPLDKGVQIWYKISPVRMNLTTCWIHLEFEKSCFAVVKLLWKRVGVTDTRNRPSHFPWQHRGCCSPFLPNVFWADMIALSPIVSLASRICTNLKYPSPQLTLKKTQGSSLQQAFCWWLDRRELTVSCHPFPNLFELPASLTRGLLLKGMKWTTLAFCQFCASSLTFWRESHSFHE